MQGKCVAGMVVLLALVSPCTAEENCSHTDDEHKLFQRIDRTFHYGTLYSGGNHYSHLDNVRGSVNLFRILNGMKPAPAVHDRIHRYPFDGWRQVPTSLQNDRWRLSTALRVALDDDTSAYTPLLSKKPGRYPSLGLKPDDLRILPMVELDLFTAPGDSGAWWLEDGIDPRWRPRQKLVHELVRGADPRQAELLDWLQSAVTSSYAPWNLEPHYTPSGTWIYADWHKLFRHALDRWTRGDGLEWAALAYELYPARAASEAALSAAGFASDGIAELDALFDELSDKVRGCRASRAETVAYIAMARAAANRVPYDRFEGRFSALQALAPETFAEVVLRLQFRLLLETRRTGAAPPHADDRLDRFSRQVLDRRDLIGTIVRTARFFRADTLDEVAEFYRGRKLDTGALKFLGILPYRVMADLASDERLVSEDRAALARTAFARAYALGREDDAWKLLDVLERAQPELAPFIGVTRRSAQAGSRTHALLLFVLWTPRLNTELLRRQDYGLLNQQWRWKVGFHWEDPPASPFRLDTRNHSWANWWCTLPSEFTSLERAGEGLRVALHGGVYGYAQTRHHVRNVEYEVTGIPDALRLTPDAAYEMVRRRIMEILKNHPIARASDPAELEALSQIPSAPESLSRKTIAWGRHTGQNGDKAAAEALHLAVRTTRYGCQLQGGHGEYSRAAFRLLHRKFGRTKWAKRTPYWFDACHFYSSLVPKRCWRHW